ncbi:MAG: NAD(P)/FAD-dependent oxidoreductase [Rickettsiales bacterium]|nr:NAD(P)/FAD-dependent oxidoreductase [Rickettsiales bacterium]
MPELKNYDIAIIGGGVVGMFMASKCIAAGLQTAIIEGSHQVGGQCTALYPDKHILNIPLVDTLTAQELCNRLYERIHDCDILLNHNVDKLAKTNDVFEIVASGKKITARYIILAIGKGHIVPNKLPLPNAVKFENKTLFYTLKDCHILQDKNVVIAGGGDSTIDWACELVDIVRGITIIHRREISKPDNPQFERFKELVAAGKIVVKAPCNIVSIEGDEDIGTLNKVITSDGEVETDYVLAFYGLKNEPATFLKDMTNIKSSFGIVDVDCKCETAEPNLFAIGDCCNYDGKLKNIPIGFSEAIRCFTEICAREKNGINMYGKSAKH